MRACVHGERSPREEIGILSVSVKENEPDPELRHALESHTEMKYSYTNSVTKMELIYIQQVTGRRKFESNISPTLKIVTVFSRAIQSARLASHSGYYSPLIGMLS